MSRDIAKEFGLNYLLKDNKVDGLTLRDLFAAFALVGLSGVEGVGGQITWTAATAYDLADAMMAQRAQVKEQS